MLVGANQNETIILTLSTGKGDAQPGTPSLPTSGGLGCPSGDAANARKINNIPVWRYLFANNKPGSSVGARHGEDVPFVFGDGIGISKLFQSSWAAFVKDPENGLSKLNWPKYDPKGKKPCRP
jgi:cholinesterase